MADIRPFKCVRPEKSVASLVAALPYDVYSRSEAKEAVAGKPLSFLNIDRSETAFPDDEDMYSDKMYAAAASMYKARLDDGTFVKDDDASYYLYELIMDGRSQTGIVACASIDDYLNNVIKKHENTREEKELDRIRHVDTLGAQTGPIFLAYRRNDEIAEAVSQCRKNPPLYAFTSDDGITHNVWKMTDSTQTASVNAAFSAMNDIYIADGHHRAASAVKVGLKRRSGAASPDSEAEYNYFLCVLFPDDELKILPYNRVVKSLNGLTSEEFMNVMGKDFEIEKADKAVEPEAKGTFGMYLRGEWYLLTAKPHILSDDPVAGLDVSILQDNLLAPVLGIKDPRTDNNIEFVGGIRGTKELEKKCGEGVAFSMHPTSIGELFTVADAGKLMPPKSTWFEPKLRSGIFIHEI